MATDPTRLLVENLFAVTGLSNGLSLEVRELIEELFAEIVAELRRMDPTELASEVAQRVRVQRLLAEVEEAAGEMADEVFELVHGRLAAIGAQQSRFAANLLTRSIGPIEVAIEPGTIGVPLWRKILDTDPVHGELLRDWADGLSTKAVDGFRREVHLGMSRSATLDEMVRAVRGRSDGNGGYVGGVMNTTTRSAEATIRTAVNDISNQALMDTWTENEDVIAGYTVVATLDDRTCFQAGTLVQMADGTLRPIERIRPGDRVLSGTGAARSVKATSRKWATEWRTIDADGHRIRATADHRFWTDEGWTEAARLATRRVGLRPLLEAFQVARESSTALLLSDLLPRRHQGDVLQPRVRALSSSVHGSGDLRREESNVGRDVLGSLPASPSSEGARRRRDYVPLRHVLEAVHEASLSDLQREARTLLLESMSHTENDRAVRDMLKARIESSSGAPSLLLRRMLSPIGRGDAHRGVGAGGIGSDRTPVRSGSAAGQVFGGLRRSGETRDRGGRSLLAFEVGRSSRAQRGSDRGEGLGVCPVHDSRSGRRGASDGAQVTGEAVPRPARWTSVVRVSPDSEGGWAYDIEVEADHSFLVGGAGFIVHNCLICGPLDGKDFDLDDASGRPPFHIGCRCTTVPRIAWKRLGVPAPDEGTRASQDGPVPASLDYEGWLRDQDAETQNEILGPSRAELFRDGKVDLADLVRSDGRVVTLDELS